jgi:ATP-dependent Clp protease ATP-binding subunit ClpC
MLIDLFLRKEKKRLKEQWQPQHYAVSRHECVTSLSCEILLKNPPFPFDSAENPLMLRIFGQGEKMVGAHEIDQVGCDLGHAYPDRLQRAWYREDLLPRLATVIFGSEPLPVVLVGPPGCGKTALIHETLWRHIDAQRQQPFHTLAKIWQIDPLRLIAGMAVIGKWQERLAAIIHFIRNRLGQEYQLPGHDTIYLDTMLALLKVGKSSQNSLTLAHVFKPYLEKGELSLIGEATPAEWRLFQQTDRRLADLFQVIRVDEPSRADASRIYVRQRQRLEAELAGDIANEPFLLLYDRQQQYPGHQAAPGRFIAPLARLAQQHRQKAISTEMVRAEFQRQNVQPAWLLADDQRELPSSSYFAAALIGQPEAVECLSDTVQLIKAGLSDPEKPAGTYLFIGPTGVGKTEAAKVLARAIFADEAQQQLLRFDMNEFIDSDAPRRLIGDFWRPEGQLTSQVRYKPFAILLFDEIEKAHPLVHDLLLQVLGEGRLSDALGRSVDFTQTIIIMTSNIGASEVKKMSGFSRSSNDRVQTYRQAVQKFFRPEFLNRIDRIIPFRPLDLADIKQLVWLEIAKILAREGLRRHHIVVDLSAKALGYLAEQGYSQELGGRALKRFLEQRLVTLIAARLAEIPRTTPLIFHVFLQEGQLAGKMINLAEAALPARSLPGSNAALADAPTWLHRGYQELGTMQRRLIEENALPHGVDENSPPADLLRYSLREQMQHLQERIFQRLSGLEWQQRRRRIQAGGPSKRRASNLKWLTLDDRHRFGQDMRRGLDIVDIMSEHYARAIPCDDGLSSSLTLLQAELASLRFFFGGWLAGRVERVALQIQPLARHPDWPAFRAIVSRFYETFLTAHGILYEAGGDPAAELLYLCHGYRLGELWQPEAGIHLIFPSSGGFCPCHLRVTPIDRDIPISTIGPQLRQQGQAWLRRLEDGELIAGEAPGPDYGRIIRCYGVDLRQQRLHLVDIGRALICQDIPRPGEIDLLFMLEMAKLEQLPGEEANSCPE